MFYYNNCEMCYESTKLIKTDYFNIFANDYETFSEYLNCCMECNNGVLQTLSARETKLKNLICSLENNDGDDETNRAYTCELETVRALRAQEKTGEFAIINFTFDGKYKITDRSGKTLYGYSGSGYDDIPFDVVLREIIRIEFDDGIIITVE